MKQIYIIFFLLFSMSLFYGCLDDPDMPDGIINGKAPEISGFAINENKAESIKVSAKISKHNGAKATEYGYYYTSNDDKKNILVTGVSAENGVITFDTIISGLKPCTEYRVWAYAINSIGESQSDTIWITTNDGHGRVRTLAPSKIKGTSAEVGGEVEYAGESEVTERGVYFVRLKENLSAENIWKSPSRDSVRTTETKDPYYLTLHSLTPETKYYVRAYAKNSFGIFLGTTIDSLTTKDGKPLLSNPVATTGFTDAKLSATVTDGGDTEVTERGVCWSKTQTPPPAIDGTGVDTIRVGQGTGAFIAELTGLDPETTYYARAYAINSFGVKYSEEVITFSTKGIKPLVQTGEIVPDNVNGIITISGNVTSQGMTPIDSAGFCWSTSPNPTIDKDSVLNCWNKEGAYSGVIRTLKGGTKYYIRAFASNKDETSYGETKEYTPPAIFQTGDGFTGGIYTQNTNAYFTIKESVFILGGDVGSKYTDKLWKYNTKNTWVEMDKFPAGERKWQTAVTIGDICFTLGGVDKAGVLYDDYYVYRPYNNTWESSPKGPDALHSAVGSSFENSAFFIGGNRGGAINEVWHYNVFTHWERKPDFPTAQYGGMSVAINKVIYAGLGVRSDGTLNTKLWSSSDNCETWESELSIPLSTGIIRGGVVHKGLIYVINESTGTLWSYDPTEKIWTKKSTLPAANRPFHCMFVLNDDNYIYIGLGQYSNTLLKYDPTWDN